MIYRLKQKFDNVRLPQFAGGGVAVIVYAVTSAIKTTRQKKR